MNNGFFFFYKLYFLNFKNTIRTLSFYNFFFRIYSWELIFLFFIGLLKISTGKNCYARKSNEQVLPLGTEKEPNKFLMNAAVLFH